MSFYDEHEKLQKYDFDYFFQEVTKDRISDILRKDHISEEEFLCLLSPIAEDFLEEMAQKARKDNLSNFGRVVSLYTPIYISNYCENTCLYCSYNAENNIKRKKLSLEEIEEEAISIYKTGLRHILILTGESRFHSPISYIKDCVKIMKKYFSSISIEIYPLEEEEYRELVDVGVDGLTIYQETYDKNTYHRIHVSGPKSNYRYRIETPERASRAGIRAIGVGALYGLSDWRREAYFSGLHAKFIQDNFPDMEINMSVPRIRPFLGALLEINEITEKNLVQIMLAFKIFLPRAGINITTREGEKLRDNLIPLGVTKLSAGVSTEVGGHSKGNRGTSQFEIADRRNVQEIKAMLIAKGYCPVLKDWEPMQ